VSNEIRKALAEEMREFVDKGLKAKHGRTFIAHWLVTFINEWEKGPTDAKKP